MDIEVSIVLFLTKKTKSDIILMKDNLRLDIKCHK